jgi:hypothetical protein
MRGILYATFCLTNWRFTVTGALETLQELLKELFQIENTADLDFGIYRI